MWELQRMITMLKRRLKKQQQLRLARISTIDEATPLPVESTTLVASNVEAVTSTVRDGGLSGKTGNSSSAGIAGNLSNLAQKPSTPGESQIDTGTPHKAGSLAGINMRLGGGVKGPTANDLDQEEVLNLTLRLVYSGINCSLYHPNIRFNSLYRSSLTFAGYTFTRPTYFKANTKRHF
ncbi:unnamed protein product [Protopolystoma xenopodis]|uniref:Uncharacterized protein n=1 Tax=Protopolystoma xenopodis TaxID=117903 RepID=A0A3S5BKL2_9PLAT|nr:unnamed protein product [Protopolystoma xenopodis]